MNQSKFPVQMLQVLQRTPLASVPPLLRNSILQCLLCSSFCCVNFNNPYVKVVSEIEYLVFIHSTLYGVMHWIDVCSLSM